MKKEKRIKDYIYNEEARDVEQSPIFALVSEASEQDSTLSEIYFLNLGQEVLDSVTSAPGGFTTEDDESVALGSNTYVYENVEADEAVLIGVFDMIYDSDFVLQDEIRIKSGNLGELSIKTPPKKGAFYTGVLMWSDGTSPKNIIVD